MFVDRAVISIRSGRGGNGAVSFRREPFVPDGGPDGGDGGRGGDVVFVADAGLRTLMDFKYKKKYAAEDGRDGARRKRFGKNGENVVIRVPPGTLVIDEATGRAMADLVRDGDRFTAAKGGKGGKGNVNFKTAVRQAPNFAEAGGFADERGVVLELKLIADVGLIGFPNAGKSTLLAAATSANPKIGDYPFTTLSPNLGVVELYDTSFVLADIPGITEGAHEGVGLGLDFLKHIERTRVLIHVVDVSGAEGRDPVEDFHVINAEMASYTENLLRKPRLVAANKTDALQGNEADLARFRRELEKLGYAVFPISAAGRTGVDELLKAAAGELARAEAEADDADAGFGPVMPETPEDDDARYREIEIASERDGDERIFVLRGRQLLKIFNSTNFNDMGSVRYLYRHIDKRGAVARMKTMGLTDGDTIRIEDYEFTYSDE